MTRVGTFAASDPHVVARWEKGRVLKPLLGESRLAPSAGLSDAHGAAPRLWQETALALGAAMLVLWFGTKIVLNPLVRTEQVSAMANLQALVLVFISAPMAILVVTAWRLGSPAMLGRATAIAAGSSSGIVAGLMAIALHGTKCAVNSLGGDAGRLVIWAANPGTAPSEYPPLPVLAIRMLSTLTGTPEPYVWRNLSLFLLAITGPVLYVGWRIVYGPALSLVLGSVLGLVFIDPYKPYSSLPLGISFLILVVMATRLRNGYVGWMSAVRVGLATGVVALIYPGWFVWMLPGFVLFLLLLPWRTSWRPLLRYLAISAGVTLSVTSWWIFPAVEGFRTLRDIFVYPDVWLRPTYFAAWQADTPQFGVRLPQFGEFGNLDTYSLVLVGLVALGLVLRGSTTVGILATTVFVGAWLRKMQIASAFRDSGLVQLFPRANLVLLLMALSLAVLGFAALVALINARFKPGGFGLPLVPVLLILGGGLFIPMLAEAATDGYMASDDGKGVLTKRALSDACWPIPENAQPWVPE